MIVGPLTRRQTEIAGMAATGMTEPEMATELWLAKRTIKFHLTCIYDRLSLRNRAELVRWWIYEVEMSVDRPYVVEVATIDD